MDLMAGEYSITEENRVKLIENFGRISSKAIRRELIIENEVFYPEYCLYEDNPLRFIYPFFIKKFLKTDFVGYLHHLEFESITRSKINLRTFDRLQTAIYGIERGLKLTNNDAEIKVLERIFIEIYLQITTGLLLTKKPSKNWIITWRLMKNYRDIAYKLNIQSSPFGTFKKTIYTKKVRFYFAVQWAASFLITKDQTEYFDTIHKKAWN